ncbi:MAG TPA: ShlB/FhaC/HecB family hemolysin secretion/activation protein, partial [Bacteroidia bacterium]|nr:ShlB/FhaC/HecB family hemolysin secretion/activation protein [Bacteroidia bacterium]
VAGNGWVCSQDDLGGLPPLPDLDLGDPQRKMSLKEKRQKARKANEARYEDNVYHRTPEDTGRSTIGQRISANAEKAKERKAVPQSVMVANSLPTSEDGITASGSRLKAFGDEDYWGSVPPPTPEESLIDLPPLPDLRTPDQVTKRERLRDLRVAKFEQRKAELEATREEKEMLKRAVVNRPEVDPSTALVQVESQGGMGGSYIGNQAAPETVDQGTLKPFNEGSTYYKDNQLLYKGRKPEQPVQTLWKKGTTEQGGPAEAQPKWRWRNPLAEVKDDVQPVSFGNPGGGGSHAASPTTDPTPLTSDLRGIRVVRSTREVVKGAPKGFSGVVTEGVELPPKVYNVLSARVGQPMTLGSLNQMVRDAVLAYRKSDLPVVDVLVPEQEITSGVLQLVVIEGRLGDVIVEGASSAESRSLARQIRTQRGEVIRESNLTEDLNWINKHPNRQVDLVFSPGGGYGETDVILRNETTRDLAGYVSLENSGTALLGENRVIFGASWTGPLFLGQDSILSYQFTTSIDSESDLFGHSGVFASYLPWRHQITLLGAYVGSEATFDAGNGVLFDTGGVNKQISGRYGIPLPSLGRMTHELELGMDFKSSNSDLAFNNSFTIFDTTSEIVQYSLGYNIVSRDDTGIWRMDSEVVSSPGGNTNKNTDAIFNSQRGGATANYTYGQVTIERDQLLPKGWTAYGRIQGQASNGNLLASEKLGAGGYDSVRGWEQRARGGDNGLVASAELRTPVIYPSTFAGFQNVQDGAYGLIFFDYASLSEEKPDPLTGFKADDIQMGSFGLGFRYQRDNWFSLRVDYGFQVTEEGFDDGQQGRWHVGATATF